MITIITVLLFLFIIIIMVRHLKNQTEKIENITTKGVSAGQNTFKKEREDRKSSAICISQT